MAIKPSIRPAIPVDPFQPIPPSTHADSLWQLVKAARADFLRPLDGQAARRPWVTGLGRIGYFARGLVFLIMGWFLVKAGLAADASQAGGMDAVLRSFSSGLRYVVATGLLLFGLFSFVEACYRRINDPDVLRWMTGAAQAARA